MAKKDKYIRDDPKSYKKYYLLRFLNWLVPICIVIVGIFVSTQKFAGTMNYDPRIVGKPLAAINNYRIYNPGIFLMGTFKYAFNKVYSDYFFDSFPPILYSFGIAFVIYFITSLILNSHQKNQNAYGTANFADKRVLKEAGHLQNYGVVCGELESADVYSKINPDPEKANLVLHIRKSFLTRKPKTAHLICHSGALNTWMIAPTGGGKGVGVVIPTCLLYGVPYWKNVSLFNFVKKGMKEHPCLQNFFSFVLPHEKVIKGARSLICYDPKQENFDATAGWRSKFSIIIPLRLVDAEHQGTAHYNPLLEIPDNPETAFSWASTIASIFFPPEKAQGENGFWQNSARDIFTGVILHVRFAPESVIPRKDKNFKKILSFMSQASNAGTINSESSEEETEGCGLKMLFEMATTDHGSDIINEQVRDAANRSKTMQDKERGSVYSTVFSEINLFSDPLIAEATSYSDFSIDDFIHGKNPISLYLIVDYSNIGRVAPVFRMIMTFMIKKFSAGTTNATSVKLKIPCMFLLDEFPTLGKYSEIAENMGVLRGYGVTFFLISQSIQQMNDIYGDKHPFMGHCKTKIIYAPNEPQDAKQISEILGNRSVLLDNKSSSMSSMDSANLSSQEVSVALMNPDEVMKLNYSRCLVLIEGNAPYKGKKVVYYEDPRFKDKAWLPVPDFEYFKKTWRTMPSNKIVRKTPIEEVQEIEVEKEIPSDFDIFTA